MKSILRKMVAVFCLMVAMVATVDAQSSFAYQAVIRTANGEVVSEKKVSMRFSLKYNNEVVYSETHQPTTSKYGNVEVKVGEGQKVSGDFAKVPWHTMQVMMQIEADPNGGTNYIDLGAIQLQPAPYAMHAASTGLVVDSSSPKSGSGALFEVKDKDGNPVFAVYPDGVRVYVDDADGKAIATGFAVAGRRAAKDGEEANLFSVTSEGTQVTVDDAEGKAMQTGFAVAGRRAAKDADAELFTVNSTGTQVYIDTDADGKAMATGFAVAGRRAAKDGETDKYLEINESGTQIYIDDDAEGKPIATGFAVAGRRAAKGNNKYMEVTADGTTVFVDNADGKAMATGFAVAGRRAAKGKNLKLFEVNEYGTHIYIDEDAADKAMATGFAVAGRRAAKDGSPEKYMVIDADGAIIYVDYDDAKAMQTGFAVAGRRAAKDGAPSSILTVNNHDGTHVYIDDAEGKAMQTGFAVAGRRAAKDGQYIMQITDKSALMVTQNLMIDDKESNKSMMTMTTEGTVIKTENFVVAKEVENSDGTVEETSVFQATPEQGVQIAAESKVVVTGDVAKAKNLQTIEANEGAVLPGPISVFSEIVDTICSKYANILGQTNGYKLVKIHGKGLYTVNDNYDADGNAVIMFNKDGKVTYDNKSAALVVILTNPDSYKDAKMIFWPCCQINNLIVNFGLMDADGSNEYLPVQVVVNSVDGGVSRVELLSANEKMGTVELDGVPAYGTIVSAVAKPKPGYEFVAWGVGDGQQEEWINEETGERQVEWYFDEMRYSNPYNFAVGFEDVKLTALFEEKTCEVQLLSDPRNGGTIKVSMEESISNGRGGFTLSEVVIENTDNYYVEDCPFGESFKLVAEPAEGFKFKNWNNNPQLTNPVIDVFTVTDDTLLKAIFEPIETTQPYGGKAATLPGVIEAENFDIGLGAYNNVTSGTSWRNYQQQPYYYNIAYRDDDTAVGIDSVFAGGEYALSFTGGEWYDYTVHVDKAQAMRWAIRYSYYNNLNATIEITRDNETVTGIVESAPTIGWWVYNMVSGVTENALPAGDYKLRLNFSKGGSNVDKIMFGNADDVLLSINIDKLGTPLDGDERWMPMGTVTGYGFYTQGTDVTIRAVPDKGFRFVRWSDGDSDSERTIEKLSEDMNLVAYFCRENDEIEEEDETDLSKKVGKNEQVVDDNTWYIHDYGDDGKQRVTASGYDEEVGAAYVTFNGEGAENDYDVQFCNVISRGLPYQAEGNKFSIEFEAKWEPNGEVDRDATTIKVVTGKKRPYSSDNNYQWGEDNAELIDESGEIVKSSLLTIEKDWTPVSWEAFIGKCGEFVDEEYNMGAQIGLEMDLINRNFDDGNSGTFWFRNVTVKMEDMVVAQYFIGHDFEVNATPNESSYGSVTGAGSFKYGAIAELEAAPASGYQFVRWSDGYPYNTREITVTTDVDIQAVFCSDDKELYNVSVREVVDEVLDRTIVGAGPYYEGETVTLTALPRRYFDRWRYDDDEWQMLYSVDNPLIIEDIHEDLNLIANFHEYDEAVVHIYSNMPENQDGSAPFDVKLDGRSINCTDYKELENGKYLYTYQCIRGQEVELIGPQTDQFKGWEYEEKNVGTTHTFTPTFAPGEPVYIFRAVFEEPVQQPTGATIQVKTNGEIQLTVGDQPLTANEAQEEDGYTTYTFTCAKGDNVTFTALNDFFFNGWWYDGEFEPEVSTILGEKYNPDEWTLEDALADIKEKYCPGGFDWNEDHWGVEGYGKTFTITIGDEEELALTAMYSLPPAPDTKVEYSILDESAKTCAITHVGVDYFNDEVTAFEIPETVELEGGTYTVTAIGDNAFYGCHYLETVTLSQNITSIPNGCFCDCWNLKNINSEDGVEIPSGVTSIGSNAFRNCQYQLAKVTIPDGVTYIGDYAFYSCHQLTSISVPGTVEFVGSTAFPTYSDDNLTFIEKNGVKYLGYTDGEATHCVVLIDGKSYSGEYTVESDCKFIYNSAFHGNNNITKVIIPGGCAIKGIGDDAFNNCHMLASINIPEGVTCVGNKAFYRCQRIQEMNIPSTIKTIGEDAFTFAIYDNEYATLGQELYSQEGNGLYLGNSQNPCLCLAKPVSGDIAELEISSRCKFILTEALKGCANLINLYVPESVTSIGNNAFADGIININYSGTPEDDKWGALYRNTSVTGDFLYADEDETEITKYIGSSEVVNVPAGVTAIGEEAFRGRSVTSVNLPDGVVTIGKSAFSNCAELSSMILPSTVESIGDYAFSNCEGMHSVYLPEGLKSVGQYAFQGCRSLVSVVVPESVENMGFYAFNQCDRKIVIFCMRDKEPEDLDYNTPWNRLWNGGYEENYGDIKYNVVWRQNSEESGFESDNIYCSNDGLLYFIYKFDASEETSNINEYALQNLTSESNFTATNGEAIVIGYHGSRSDALELTIPSELGDDSKALRSEVVAIARYAFYRENISSLTIGDDGSKAATPKFNLRFIGQGAFCNARLRTLTLNGDESGTWYKYNYAEGGDAQKVTMNANELTTNSCENEFYRDDSKAHTFYVHPDFYLNEYNAYGEGTEESPFKYFAYAVQAIADNAQDDDTPDVYTVIFNSYNADSVCHVTANIEDLLKSENENVKNVKIKLDMTNILFSGNKMEPIGGNLRAQSFHMATTESGTPSWEVNEGNGLTNLVEVVLPDGIEEISSEAFKNCSNLVMTVPASVKTIGKGAFYGCNMQNITFENQEGWYVSTDNVNFSNDPVSASDFDFSGDNIYDRQINYEISMTADANLTENSGTVVFTFGEDYDGNLSDVGVYVYNYDKGVQNVGNNYSLAVDEDAHTITMYIIDMEPNSGYSVSLYAGCEGGVVDFTSSPKPQRLFGETFYVNN